MKPYSPKPTLTVFWQGCLKLGSGGLERQGRRGRGLLYFNNTIRCYFAPPCGYCRKIFRTIFLSMFIDVSLLLVEKNIFLNRFYSRSSILINFYQVVLDNYANFLTTSAEAIYMGIQPLVFMIRISEGSSDFPNASCTFCGTVPCGGFGTSLDGHQDCNHIIAWEVYVVQVGGVH